ncbi:ankyrin repeat family protein [Anaeramoeba flamelloides]|uniref:Ankyrin repeat family protein n=1 Tax=Anaeramoeba flamelloides TaxID=1746091 RepID=A0ABQ8ZDM8_9EUKA|nr:ankyrin repeat family protein [Anaeramoeba flamelloides]
MSKMTPLHHAAKRGTESWIRELLKEGVDNINAKDNFGWTPLHYAASGGHQMCCWYILDAGADIEAKDDTGDTPLHKSAWKGHLDTVNHLLEWGADKTSKNNEGKYPLDLARETKIAVVLQLDLSEEGSENELSD